MMPAKNTGRGGPSGEVGPGAQQPGYGSTKIPEKEFPIQADGTRDYLQVDPPVPGQNWACMSFISPEDMVQKRNLYYFNQFLYAEVNKSLKDQAVHMAKEVNVLLCQTFETKIEKLKKSVNETDNLVAEHLDKAYKDLQIEEDEFAGRCMHLYKVDYDEIHDKYSMYKTQNATEMDKKFDQENDFKTSIRGFKVRGVFNERKQADLKAKDFRELGEPVHVFVAPVGYWCPWDPDPDAIQDSDYMLPALNELMGKYHENVREKNKFFEERKHDLVEDANMSNRERIKARLRQRMMEKRQAKLEQEMKQSRLDKEMNENKTNDLTEEQRDALIQELLAQEEKRTNGKKNQNGNKNNKNRRKR